MNKPKRTVSLLVAAASLFAGVAFLAGGNEVKASAEEVTDSAGVIETGDDVSTRGLFTSLSLSINGGDGKIWATVRNDITIFPSTVKVIVELYNSPIYQENYENMTLVVRKSTPDLNIGDSIVAESPTYGVQKYWQARMRYKVDDKAWESRNTGTLLYSADGEFLDIT